MTRSKKFDLSIKAKALRLYAVQMRIDLPESTLERAFDLAQARRADELAAAYEGLLATASHYPSGRRRP